MATYPGSTVFPSEPLFPIPRDEDYDPWEIQIGTSEIEGEEGGE